MNALFKSWLCCSLALMFIIILIAMLLSLNTFAIPSKANPTEEKIDNARLTEDNLPFNQKPTTPLPNTEHYPLYQVQRGDTLTQIAKRYHVDLASLAQANDFDEPDHIYQGEEIKIPIDSILPYESNDNGSSQSIAWQWPVRGFITQGYGPKGPGEFHHGIDIAASLNDTIVAARKGIVTLSGEMPVYGETVIINHGNGYVTLYAHASSRLVKKGDTVSEGQAVAKVGCTGHAYGCHLHFEIYQNGKTVDPLLFLPKQQ